jgi:hypothetical protein
MARCPLAVAPESLSNGYSYVYFFGMPLVLAAYDIEGEDPTARDLVAAKETRRTAVRGVIAQYQHLRLSESSYAVDVGAPVYSFVERLFAPLIAGDRAYVVGLESLVLPDPAFYANAPEHDRTWLEQHLPPREER